MVGDSLKADIEGAVAAGMRGDPAAALGRCPAAAFRQASP